MRFTELGVQQSYRLQESPDVFDIFPRSRAWNAKDESFASRDCVYADNSQQNAIKWNRVEYHNYADSGKHTDHISMLQALDVSPVDSAGVKARAHKSCEDCSFRRHHMQKTWR